MPKLVVSLLNEPPTNSFTLMCVLSLMDRIAQKKTTTCEMFYRSYNLSFTHSLILPKPNSSSTKITPEVWKLRTWNGNIDGGWKVRNPQEEKKANGEDPDKPPPILLSLFCFSEQKERERENREKGVEEDKWPSSWMNNAYSHPFWFMR